MRNNIVNPDQDVIANVQPVGEAPTGAALNVAIAGSDVNPVTVLGPLTDAELRAMDVDVIVTNEPSVNLQDGAGNDLTSTVNTDRTTDLDGVRGLNTNAMMFGRVSDTVVKNARLDASTETQITVSYEHHELHDGTHFTYSQADSDWDISEQVRILITTPNTTKYAHFVFDFSAALDTTVDFYEDATHSASTALTAFNNNRVIGTAPTVLLNVALSDGANGTRIFTSPFGINTGGGSNKISGGGETRGSREWILKPNSKYLFLASTGTDNSSYNLKFSWYEHTDRN